MRKVLLLAALLAMIAAACGDTTDTTAIDEPPATTALAEPVDDTTADTTATTVPATTATTQAADTTEAPATTMAATSTTVTEDTAAGEGVVAASVTGEEVSPTVEAAPPQPVDVSSMPAATIADTDGYYRLQTLFLEGENKCLEGQGGAAPGSGAVLDGAAFQDDCQDVTGQLWKLVPEADGYYRLQNQIGEANALCLESNSFENTSVLNGATFMDACQDVTGQFWRFVDAGDGYYRLQSQFSEEENRCLEGNRLDPASVLAGAAFMDRCLNVTGQLWKLVPVDA